MLLPLVLHPKDHSAGVQNGEDGSYFGPFSDRSSAAR